MGALDQSNTFFPWLAGTGSASEKWTVGAILFALGFVGAVITVVLSNPGDVPRLGGSANLRKLRIEVEAADEEVKELNKRIKRTSAQDPDKPYYERLEAQHARAVERSDRAVKRLRQQSYSTLRVRVPLFTLLGGVVAATLASNMLQAITFGGSWPAILAVFGFSRQLDGLASAAAEQAKDEIDAFVAEHERDGAALVVKYRQAIQGWLRTQQALVVAANNVTRLTADLREITHTNHTR